jgi:hypothetical protein
LNKKGLALLRKRWRTGYHARANHKRLRHSLRSLGKNLPYALTTLIQAIVHGAFGVLVSFSRLLLFNHDLRRRQKLSAQTLLSKDSKRYDKSE